MGSIKDRNGRDLTEAEDIKKRWQAYTESESKVVQSCPTLCNPMDCSLSGSSVLGILQARILEWVATEERYKKIFMTQITLMVITHLESDNMECEVKWAL